MGDGRYYTFRQFYLILYFTIVSSGLVFSIMLLYVKSRKKQYSSYMVISLTCLLLFVLASFFKEVTYHLPAALTHLYVSLSGIIGYYITFFYYYTKKSWVSNSVIALVIVGFIFGYVQEFTFMMVAYTPVFKVIVSFLSFLLISLVVRHISRICKGSNTYHCSESAISGLGVFLLTGSFLIYIFKPELIGLLYVGIFSQFILFFLVFYKYMPDEKIPVGYHELIENMVDTIIVLNHDKELLYVNNTNITNLIGNKKVADLEHFENNFLLTDCEVINLGYNTHQINGKTEGKSVSLKISLEEVISREKSVGYIIAIEDCSKLEAMIAQLREKRLDLIETKGILLQYSKTEQLLVEEKERNKLLLDVQNELGHDLAALTKHVGNVTDSVRGQVIDETALMNDLEDSIDLAKGNLKRIRETVLEYRESYEGKG